MLNQNRLEMIAEVARLYYKEGMSQAEIGKIFNISHSTISRMINEAHEEKIVEIIIRYPVKTVPSLSHKIKNQFDLKAAYIMPTSGNSYRELIDNLGQLAARTVEDYLQDGITLGISLGMAVASTVRHIKITQPIHVKVVRLQGASENELMEGTDLAQTLSTQMGNDAMIIPSPWLLKRSESMQAIMQEPSVIEAIRIAERANVALVGIGSMVPETSTILQNDLITIEELNTLKSKGAVGEICGKYFDIHGNILDAEFNKRSISIDIKKMAQFDSVIGVAGSVHKVRAILGAIHGGFINVLVTDSDTAREMLKLSKNN